MARELLTIIALLSLSACQWTGGTRPEYINVCPEAPFIERPELEVLNLKDGDTPDQVIQAHRVTIKKLQKWGLEEEAVLNGYRKGQK